MTRFEPGASIVRRDVFAGRVWSVCPGRVMSDDGDELAFACWPGVEMLAPEPFIRWLRAPSSEGRDACFAALAERRWHLGSWSWMWTNVVRVVAEGRWYMVSAMYEGSSGEPRCWYVDFTRPPERGDHGIDTLDLLLDLVVDPGGAWTLKDQDEFEHGHRVGVITDAERAAVQAAQEEVIDLVERRAGPFSEDLGTWCPDPAWARPSLPVGIDRV